MSTRIVPVAVLMLCAFTAPAPLAAQQRPMAPECAPLIRRLEAGRSVGDSLHFVAFICRDSAAPALARYLQQHRTDTDTASVAGAIDELGSVLPRDSFGPLIGLARDRTASVPVRLLALVAATNRVLPLLGWKTILDYDELVTLPAGASCTGLTAIFDGYASPEGRRRSLRSYDTVLLAAQALAADTTEPQMMRTAGRCAAYIVGRVGPPVSSAVTPLPPPDSVHTAAHLRLRNICGNWFGIRSGNLGLDTVMISVDSEPPTPVVVPGLIHANDPTHGEVTFRITDATTVTMRWRGEVIQRATLGAACED